jgi:lipopolysaccharide transport system ATP-binding protein
MAELRLDVRNVGKRFARYHAQRPRTLKQIAMRGVSRLKPLEHFWAVRGLSFEVSHGAMLGVIGRNGSGKSTLLRLLGDVMRPDEGEVVRRGRLRGLFELNTGMHPDLSGRENIFINGVIAGLTHREVRKRFDEIVAFSELEQSIDNPVRTYSAGMKLRLGFATSIHVDPEILLIDEVLSVGDLAFQQKCLNQIRRFKTHGCAIVLISHDLQQIEALCDRALWIRHGVAVSQGDPVAVVANYRAEMAAETNRRTPATAKPHVTASGVKLTLHENRFGTLEAQIIDVRIHNEQGAEVDTIQSGEGLIIEMLIEAPLPLEGPRLSVSIGRGVQEDCLDVNTDADRVDIETLRGSKRVELHIGRLDLAAGYYDISVGLYEVSWQFAFDYHWRAYRFEVSGPLRHGVLAPPRMWRIS